MGGEEKNITVIVIVTEFSFGLLQILCMELMSGGCHDVTVSGRIYQRCTMHTR